MIRPLFKVRRYVTPQGCSVTSMRELDLDSGRVHEHVTLETNIELIEDGHEWPRPPAGRVRHAW